MSEETNLVALTADIVAAHVASNSVPSGEIGALISIVHRALSGLGCPAVADEPAKPQGAVSARKSLADPRHIISMIDGKPYKMLRRHVGQHGYSPESYRQAFGLPHDYPMVAQDYAKQRRALAHKIGLGRTPMAQGSASLPRTRARKPARRTLHPSFSDAVAAAKGDLGGE